MSLADELRDADIQCAELSEYVEPDRAFQMPWEVREAADAAVTALARLAIGYKARVDELESARQCGAENPHGMIPRKCPSCGEEMIPLPCMNLAMDSYKDGKRYVEAARDLAHDHILQLETERDTARAERDRARDLAVGMEQELAQVLTVLPSGPAASTSAVQQP